MMKKKEKVFVGMSGGVDSSVSAALLKRAGYDVTGVFIKVWPDSAKASPGKEPEKCTWRDDRRDAMRVAATLDIPLVTIDLSREYEKKVVQYMIREYRAGRTPNPDIECNRAIKFGAFYDWARQRRASYVATGHYARILDGKLLMSKDNPPTGGKDQTYFLWTLKSEQLKHCLFPIGGYKKSEVRKLAQKFKLPNFAKKDSQGLCFLGQVDVKKFLAKYIKTKSGQVLNEAGQIVGQHDGVWFYTIGERHHGYIVAKDIKKNLLLVSDRPPQDQHSKLVRLAQTNWLIKPETGKNYQARIRHRGELCSCRVGRERGIWQVIFSRAPLAPAPGQSLVLYDGDRCLGGGVML